MKIILTKDVENIGKEGEMKEVADGFARNYLLPNQLAEPATTENTRLAEKKLALINEQKEQELKEAQKYAEQIDGKELVIKVKADGDSVFGSVDKKKIVAAAKKEGIEINSKMIELKKSIKELGEHQIKINFNHRIEAVIKLIVEKEK